jgi:UDP-hydrolysing UDP-N-acetyl-D-glucosamine 2-epimerase
MTRKVCVVITARPSYSRIKSALLAIRDHPELELQLVVAASALLDRYGMVVSQIEEDGFDIAARVLMVLEGESPVAMAKTTGVGILELTTVFDNLQPDLVVTVADRFETLATATAAAYLGLPLVHVQGGEVSGSIDERVRHAITKLSDFHLPATRLSRDRIVRMGEDPERVEVTGCPSIDLAAAVANGPPPGFDPFERYGGVGEILDLSEGYLVVMQHPVTTEHREARAHVWSTLEAVEASGIPALWFWPNVDAGSDGTSTGIRAFREIRGAPRMHFFKNMAPDDFLRLLLGSRAIVGNSSVALRECSFLGVPAVNIGSRQVGRERGRNVVDVGYDRDEILAAIRKQVANGRLERDELYGDGAAGERIAAALATMPLDTDKRLAY